jgi:hypothetical protein
MNINRIVVVLLILAVAWSGMTWATEDHQGHTMQHDIAPAQNLPNFLVTPSLPASIQPGRSVDLTLTITDKDDRAVEQFALVHEKLIHLIVVSSDLHFFHHIHPEYQGHGRFTVQTALPAGGEILLFLRL